MSPGAAALTTRARWSPAEGPAIELTLPSPRSAVYLEIDDAAGRVWAQTATPATEGAAQLHVVAPPLPAGLYWAIAANDPSAAAALGPGTSARPFFVAATDREALAFGGHAAGARDDCAPPMAPGPADPSRPLAICLATTPVAAAPRWLALDGFVGARARAASVRARGLVVALGAVLTAIAIEAVLLLRAVAVSRRRLRLAAEDPSEAIVMGNRGGAVALALLVGLLGLLLLAASLLHA
jgi:hypothetical protein